MKPENQHTKNPDGETTSLIRRNNTQQPLVVDCEPVFVELKTVAARERFETAVEEERGKKLDLRLNNFILWLMRPLAAWAAVFTIGLFSIVYWIAIAKGLGLNPRPWENGWKWRVQSEASASSVTTLASQSAVTAVPKAESLLRANERLIKMTTTPTGVVLQVERFVPIQ